MTDDRLQMTRRSTVIALGSHHTTASPDVCVHRRRGLLDAVKQAAIKHCQNRGPLVRVQSTTEPTSSVATQSWF